MKVEITDEHLSKLDIQDNDILLLKHPKPIEMEQLARIKSKLQTGISKRITLISLPSDADLYKIDLAGLDQMRNKINKIIRERTQ